MRLPFTLPTILAAFLLFSACGGKTSRNGWTDTIAVQAMVVNDGQTEIVRNYIGSIGSEKEAELHFPLGGTLTRVAVKNGQHVNEGQLLAEVDATTAGSLHATALATLRQAEDAYRRLESVHKEGGLSDVKWMEMETNLEKARQAEVGARKHLENCSIHAPFDGVVVCGDRHVGQDIKPLEPFARLLDMRQLCVTFSVPEQEVSLLPIGTPAIATIPALDNREIQLRITDKSLIANPLGHTYKIKAAIIGGKQSAVDAQLLPDMVAKIKLNLSALGGIVVPTDCVLTLPEGTALWVVRNGKAQHAMVQVGDFIKSGVLISSGLSVGDTVVTAGYQKLYSGAVLKVTN